MMYRYDFESYTGMNSRYQCPNCGDKRKTFVRYIDTLTGKQVAPTVGRCNRSDKCGYHYTPRQYFQDNNISWDTIQPKQCELTVIPQQKTVSYIPDDLFKASLKPAAYEANHFVTFLVDLFGVKAANELISRYFIGTSTHWRGATIFWQIDTLGKVRTGKIMLYDPDTGKRVKEPFNHIHWAHKALKQPEFGLKQCLFGEHLLIDTSKPVAIVESEKTAVVASAFFPQYIWLSVGGAGNLKGEICRVLLGRTIVLFPDLNKFEDWSSKAKEFSHLARFTVSDLLERNATEAERAQGLDIADYLIQSKVRPQNYNMAKGEKTAGSKPGTQYKVMAFPT